ncbi:MAG TPA: hypothetical protein VN282_05685 [Pyrinomonadaceae bacterium]|nr:hypothetical protein [Pyrinomonadaceae bacterium]
MSRKDRKSTFLSSIKAEEQAVRSRFEKADTALARDTQKGPKGGPAVKAPEPVEPVERVVRDSYTMPPAEYETLSKVQKRCLKRGVVVSKSEVVRAGFAALARMPDGELFELIETLVKVKTGRPTEA